MKMTGLHAFSHTNEDMTHDTCAICDHAIAHNLTPIIFTATVDFHVENNMFFIPIEIKRNYSSIVLNTIIVSELFSRPPPFLL
ncbi:hypothetical protein H0I23_05865 [Cellulophaga sp. HaHaR_3_176]|uniref:hypothetical protein n=1 Tax=Cellulophaga sp. HaHaR_3_176 TaxID=1942464 RepID=UPI001C1F3D46|nr:hypothetical protein [Cellulophaga sp. HaHaR_3_176]QWX85163.1 hypothetical protein H0I23_05865 [Cellulophaga sp. HaHaR_3_176]